MSQETFRAVLRRVYHDLRFRHHVERDPAGALGQYAHDLTESEFRLLYRYPSTWKAVHQVELCSRCGGTAVVTTQRVVLHGCSCHAQRAAGAE